MNTHDSDDQGTPRSPGREAQCGGVHASGAGEFHADLALLADPDTDPDNHTREWQRVHDHFQPRLHGHFMRDLPERADREDLISEIWKRIIPRIDTLKHPAALWAWMVETGRNLRIDGSRRAATARRNAEQRAGEVTDAIMSSAAPDPLSALIQNTPPDGLQAIEEHLANLPEEDRQMLIMRAEGRSHREIASVLELSSPAASRKRLERLIERVQKSLPLP